MTAHLRTKPLPGPSPEALARNPRMRLSDPEMLPAMDELRTRIARDPAFAKRLLEKTGILDRRGKLAKNYGG